MSSTSYKFSTFIGHGRAPVRREATQHDFFPRGYCLVADIENVQPAESVHA